MSDASAASGQKKKKGRVKQVFSSVKRDNKLPPLKIPDQAFATLCALPPASSADAQLQVVAAKLVAAPQLSEQLGALQELGADPPPTRDLMSF